MRNNIIAVDRHILGALIGRVLDGIIESEEDCAEASRFFELSRSRDYVLCLMIDSFFRGGFAAKRFVRTERVVDGCTERDLRYGGPRTSGVTLELASVLPDEPPPDRWLFRDYEEILDFYSKRGHSLELANPRLLRKAADELFLFLGSIHANKKRVDYSGETGNGDLDVPMHVVIDEKLYRNASACQPDPKLGVELGAMSCSVSPWLSVLSHLGEHEMFNALFD